MLRHWMGGACAPVVPPVVPPASGGGRASSYEGFILDDEEVFTITAYMLNLCHR